MSYSKSIIIIITIPNKNCFLYVEFKKKNHINSFDINN